MSKEKRTIEITPVCTYCQGNGYHWQENCYRERYKQGCPICKGSGRLDAAVVIEWKAGDR